MDKKSKILLFDYLNNSHPPDLNHQASKFGWIMINIPWRSSINSISSHGTAVGIINPKASYKVVIEAHADEISWFIKITLGKDSYIRQNVGSSLSIFSSVRVNIYTEKGIVKGVFGWPAIHVRDAGKEEAPSLKNIFIDVGAESKKEVEAMGVHVGCVNKNFVPTN